MSGRNCSCSLSSSRLVRADGADLSPGVISYDMAGPVTAHLGEMLKNADFICWRDQF